MPLQSLEEVALPPGIHEQPIAYCTFVLTAFTITFAACEGPCGPCSTSMHICRAVSNGLHLKFSGPASPRRGGWSRS